MEKQSLNRWNKRDGGAKTQMLNRGTERSIQCSVQKKSLQNAYSMKNYFYILIFLFSSMVVKAQDEAKIRVIARPYQDSISLRWGPNKATAWHFLNEYGYRIVRKTLVRDGEIVENPDSVSSSTEIFKPKPLSVWEAFAEEDDYVYVAAQAIFGETMEITHGIAGSDIAQVINKSLELESRFSFALLAADLSPTTAVLSGLMFTDKTVKANEKYLYLIIPMVPKEKLSIDTGYVYVGVDDYKPLPRPFGVRGDFNDGSAMISWNHQLYQNIFIAYQIERSDDKGKTFKPISDKPLINTSESIYETPERMFIIDSLPQNNTEYFYRIKGVTSFGEISEPSDTISGIGYKRLPVNPYIISSSVFTNKYVTLEWEFPDSLNSRIAGFDVLRSETDNGLFDTINKQLIQADVRKFSDEPPYNYTYYKILAKDAYGHAYQSYPYLIQVIDSIPPDKPTGLAGSIDTLGVVHLHWINNTEKDLRGYRVFRSNFKNSEFTQITVGPVTDSVFTDTVNIKTLTKKVYYKIQAVDHHYNPSTFSDVAELLRPDIMPPVSPVFHSYESNEQGIILKWYNSSSIDVSKHILYRKAEQETGWKVQGIFSMADSIQEYVDTSCIEGKLYEYTILAVDEAGLESEPVKPLKIKQYENKLKPAVSDIRFDIDRQNEWLKLEWNYGYKGVTQFIIYKGDSVENLAQYASVKSFEFKDQKLKINNSYFYVIKAVYSGGLESNMSNVLEIKY